MILYKNAVIINEGRVYEGFISVEPPFISRVGEGSPSAGMEDAAVEIHDVRGGILIPGIIDTHVHFREPGMTVKATMESESHAAAAGGVTSVFEMPNTSPATVSEDEWRDKMCRADKYSWINYAFFIGGTDTNTCYTAALRERHEIPGIKLFMGTSTGNMSISDSVALDAHFSAGVPVCVHCEDNGMIDANAAAYMRKYGNDIPVDCHTDIRSREACIESTRHAIALARQHNTRLHICHVSTCDEIEMIHDASDGKITGEACLPHLMWTREDYVRHGTRIKCNPSVKETKDRDAIRNAVRDGFLSTIATDHAPHELKAKEGGALTAASGIPSVQFSLLAMLTLARQTDIPVTTVVERMCHAPARVFDIDRRGYLREGYYADFVILDTPETERYEKRPVSKDDILSKCGWSPFVGATFDAEVRQTFVNGAKVYDAVSPVNNNPHCAMPLRFRL